LATVGGTLVPGLCLSGRDGRPLEISGVDLIRQVMLDDLVQAHFLWGDHVAKLTTQRYPYNDFETALGQHPSDEIKTVAEWEV
jgi:hypothetical protein